MKLFGLFKKQEKEQPPQKTEEISREEGLEAYSGTRTEVTTLDGELLFVAKLTGVRGTEAELQQFSEASVPADSEPIHVRIRGYVDHEKKAVHLEGVIAPVRKNIWSVEGLVLHKAGNDRAFFRLETNRDGTATMYSGLEAGEKPCKLLNISIGGASIRSKAKYYEGDKFLLKISLMDNGPESAIYSEVKRVIEKEYGEFEYGCQFLELRDEDQEKITKNIFDAQCQNRRR